MITRKELIARAAILAGEEILKFDPATVSTETKANSGDLVTAADIASERVITQLIQEHFEDDLIISEETTEGQELLTAESLPTLTGWVLDPIDGTNNFKKGMGYSGISIAYVDHGEPQLGAIYDPYKKELYIAEKNVGVTRNNLPIKVSNTESFDPGTRVCTSNSSEGGTQQNLSRFEKLGYVWVDVLGSAVLIMCDVASGRLDLYHHNGLKPWDNAAAFLIAQEAGAKITGLKGQPVTWLTNEIVLGNAILVDRFVELTTN